MSPNQKYFNIIISRHFVRSVLQRQRGAGSQPERAAALPSRRWKDQATPGRRQPWLCALSSAMFPRRLQQYVIDKCTSLRCLVCSAGLIEFEETSAMTHDDLSNLSFLHIILSTTGRITLRSLKENQRSDKEATQTSASRVSIPYSYLVAMASVIRTMIPDVAPYRYPHTHRTVTGSRLLGMLITHSTIRIMSCTANVSQASQRPVTKLLSERRFLPPLTHRSYAHTWQDSAWRQLF